MKLPPFTRNHWFMASAAGIFLFLFPFLVFAPRTATPVQERKSEHSTPFQHSVDLKNPYWDYLFRYQDPRSFSDESERLGSSLSRRKSMEDKDIPRLYPELKSAERRLSMAPVELPRLPLTFEAPLMPDRILPVPAIPEKSGLSYPLLMLTDGTLLPFPSDSRVPLSMLRHMASEKPTVLKVGAPLMADMPLTVSIRTPSGVTVLDRSALSMVSRMLLQEAFRRKIAGAECLTVYWRPPEVRIAESPDKGAAL